MTPGLVVPKLVGGGGQRCGIQARKPVQGSLELIREICDKLGLQANLLVGTII